MTDLLAIHFPNIDPVMFQLGPLAIRWYGFCYLLGFAAGFWVLRKLSSMGQLPLQKQEIWDFLGAAMMGVIVGGRLGYVLIYKPLFYFSRPLQILHIWDGGMSFHGGMLGVAVAAFLFCRRRNLPLLSILDAACVAATPGLLFVRCANFVNQELWGRPTEVPWAVIFSNPAAGGVPRHPSQLYEGFLEGGVLFVVLFSLARRPGFQRRGALSAAFLLGYGILRFGVEFFREPDRQLGAIIGPFSMGHLLCAGMIAAGAWGLLRLRKRPVSPA